jgi:hypothetical protein
MTTASEHENEGTQAVRVEGISAVTLATHDMARAVRFYRALGVCCIPKPHSALCIPQ